MVPRVRDLSGAISDPEFDRRPGLARGVPRIKSMEQASRVLNHATFSDIRWVELIRAEYAEMPDLHLTPVQMQRLWGMDPDTCRAVIDALVARDALRKTPAGGYARFRARN